MLGIAWARSSAVLSALGLRSSNTELDEREPWTKRGRAMAEDFAATLFTEARAHHEAARRWFLIGITSLAVFHIMIFRPYVDLSGQKAVAAHTLTENAQLKKRLDEVAQSLGHLSDLTTQNAKPRLDDLLRDLRNTFEGVNSIVDKLRSIGPEKAGGDEGEQLLALRASYPMASNLSAQVANVQAQVAPAPALTEPSLPTMSASLRRDIASANSEQSLLVAIKPYIEQEIIAPKFSSFNKSWHDEVAPELDQIGAKLSSQIQGAKSLFPGEAPTWINLERIVSDFVTTAKNFKIEPPSTPFWWSQSASKEGTFHGFLRVLSETELTRSPVFAQLQRRIDEAISTNRSQQEEIDQRFNELEKEFREQQAALAEFAGPLKGISIDLATIVPYVPIILAVAFIALTGLLASRTQELGETVALVERQETPDRSAQEWLRARITASPWHRPASILARCVAFAIWIAFASWELAGASVVNADEATLFGVVGGLGMALASRYEWRVVRSLRGSLGGG